MGFQLTQQQQAVVDNRGGALLVSAAAGSGKTRVLVERLLDRVEREGLNIDRFLVITYTKAAAAELRSRIVEEISDRLIRHPDNGHLRRQTTLVYKAQISTVHAFCAQLLREQGHLLDLNPDFRLLDESEASLLMLDTLTDVLERRYEEIKEEDDFALLVDTMSAGRDDSRLIQIVLDIRGRVQSHPHPDTWLTQQEETFELSHVEEAGETSWGKLLLADAARQADYWMQQIARALELSTCDEVFQANYSPSLSATLDGLRAFRDGAYSGWDQARAVLPIPFPTPGRKKIPVGIPETEQVKELRNRCKKRMEKLAEGFVDSGADLLSDLRAVFPAVRGLFALVRDFEAAYTAEKKRRGVLDFSDLEHLAVRLLVGEQGPTELADDLSGRYDEIMVDEYQDTNEVQNAVFSALSRGGKNLFLVGDVKQSIYRFRLADPTIFLEKYRTFLPDTQAKVGEARRIILSKNFRSRVQVLEGANFLFRNLMSTEFGEMDYTDDEALYAGADFPEGGNCAVELDALDLSEEDAEEDTQPREEQAAKVAKDLQEARFAARRIRQLLDEGFPVSDGAGGLRSVRGEDIVILLRSPGTVLHHYARALGERGIQWEADGGGDFFAATEISVALSYLRIIDNPRQDVPLISLLRSPVYGFSADQLSLLRAGCPEGDFYDAVCSGAAEGDQACKDFLHELADLRFGVGDRSCHQLIWHLYDRTNLVGVFGAMADGEARQANLLLLSELARKFEGAGHRGLFGFLTYLTRLQEQGGHITTPSTAQAGGGVRILSIHRSKGLEFPVVLLCGLSRRLNREDMQRPILFHSKLGVGPKRLDTQRMVEYPTLARRAVARQLEYEMMAEELRLLYVAVTRAREKLILSVALTGGGRDIARLMADAGCPAEPQALAACQSVGQWVLLPVLMRPEAHPLRAAAGVELLPISAEWGPEWDIRWVREDLTHLPAERCAGEEQTEEECVPFGLLERLSWVYPYRADVEIPSKLTATQLKGRELDSEVAEDTDQAARLEPEPTMHNHSLRRPRFAEEEFGLTPAQKGTSLHLVMQYIDFTKTNSATQVRREVERLVREEFLTPEQGNAVDETKIAAFFASPLGREVRTSPTLRREFKFSILSPAKQYWDNADVEETVLLQGVVDCYFETLEGITVVDFKTDRVGKDRLLERAEEYRAQLMTYARALEEITGRNVVRRVLWFFSQNTAVEV